MPRRRRHCLAVDYNTANPALRVAALAQNATDEPVEATSEVFLLQKGSTTRRSTPRGPKESNIQILPRVPKTCLLKLGIQLKYSSV